jgi:hypothetical protein
MACSIRILIDEIARLVTFSGGGEFPTRGFFLGLDDGDPIASIALESHILIETTATWEGIAFQISQAFIMRLSLIGGTQETHWTGLIDDEEVFDRMAFLLAPIVVLLVLWIGWAVDRSLRTIMPKRGAEGNLPSVLLRASPRTHRPYVLAVSLGGLRPDSTRHAGDESTYWHSIETCQSVGLALLEWDFVSQTSK